MSVGPKWHSPYDLVPPEWGGGRRRRRVSDVGHEALGGLVPLDPSVVTVLVRLLLCGWRLLNLVKRFVKFVSS